MILDSGVRSGADIFRALALGANAVLLGRPYVYGLGIAGQTGVEEVIRNFLADFDLTMGLAGCRSVSEIGREALTLRRLTASAVAQPADLEPGRLAISRSQNGTRFQRSSEKARV